jgi:hypothetical protein
VTRRRRLPFLALFAGLAVLCGLARDGRAQEGEGEPSREELPTGSHLRAIDKDESTNPLRGSTLHLEQSMTTETTQLQPSPTLSYVPLYELWLSFRPRYYFDEHWNIRGRFDYTKELTNNQNTTYYREDVFGDIWTDLVYSTNLNSSWRGTKVNLGLRSLLPTSKVSQANGTYVTLGAQASARHRFQIRGADAPVLNEFDLGLSLTYLHAFTNATTPTSYGNFAYTRQDVDGFSFTSDQIQGQTLVDHTFWTILNTELRITPRLSITGDAILINQWHYQPSNTPVKTTTGSVTYSNANDPQFTQNVWIIAGLDYILFGGEFDLSLGYFSLANAIAPDGQRRGLFGSDNVWWSPDARVFLDLTANIDVLFDDASSHRYSPSKAAEAARLRHIADLESR